MNLGVYGSPVCSCTCLSINIYTIWVQRDPIEHFCHLLCYQGSNTIHDREWLSISIHGMSDQVVNQGKELQINDISFKDFRKLQRNYRYNHLVSKKNVLSIYGNVVNVITLDKQTRDKQTRVENHSADVYKGNSKYCTQEWKGEVKSKMTQLVLWIIQDANIKIEIYFKIILKHSYKDARLQNFASCGSLKQTTLISAEVIKQKVSSFVESLWSKAWGRWKRWE